MKKIPDKKICAIICEFNPFHNGHKYLVDNVKKQSGCDYIMGIMGGNFTQRGDISILDKYDKATLATKCGVDIIVTLPTAYTVASSEIFALAGVKVANAFDNVTHLAFGSECGDIELLKRCADFFLDESNEYSRNIKSYLKQGYSYNTSRLKALESMRSDPFISQVIDVVSKPNNILAIEYIKALKKIKSDIIPITIQRIGDYNSDKLDAFASASAIRKATSDNQLKKLDIAMPSNIVDEYKKMVSVNSIDYSAYESIALYAFRTMSPSYLKSINDVTEGLENNLISNAISSKTLTEFINKAMSKRYTESKIRRIILSALLNIDKDVIRNLYRRNLPYIKVLSISNKEIMSYLGCSTTLLTRSSDKRFILSKYYVDLVNIENLSDQLYATITNKYNNVSYLNQKTIFLNQK